MNEKQLLRVFGMIDDRFIEELYHNEKAPRKKFRGTTLIVIAAVLSLLTMTALAAETTPENWFYRFFSDKPVTQTIEVLTENQQEILNQGLVCSDQSVTQNGFTITLESSISDGHRALLKFRADGPEDISLDAPKYSLLLETNIELPDAEEGNFGVSSSGGTMLRDDDPNDNSITFLREYIFQAPTETGFSLVDGSTWSIHIDGIQTYRDSSPVMVAEGSWDFTVKFPENLLVTNTVELLDNPIKCSAKRELWGKKYDVNLKLTSFQLRTLSATILHDRPLTGFWEGVNLNPIHVVMNDGSRIKAEFQMWANRGDYGEFFYVFDRPISFEDMAYVDFSQP